MNIIVWIIFGALAGWIASLIAGTDARQGAVANVVVGIVGAFAGGFLMQLIGKSGNAPGLIGRKKSNYES